MIFSMKQTLNPPSVVVVGWGSSPPHAASPARRSGASAAAPCQHRRDAPGALWSKLSEPPPARAPASRPDASAAPPPDTTELDRRFRFYPGVQVLRGHSESVFFFIQLMLRCGWLL